MQPKTRIVTQCDARLRMNKVSTWTRWAHEQGEHMNKVSTWTRWAHDQGEHMNKVSTWTRWAHEQGEYMNKVSTWTRWVHEQGEYMNKVSTWTSWSTDKNTYILSFYMYHLVVNKHFPLWINIKCDLNLRSRDTGLAGDLLSWYV